MTSGTSRPYASLMTRKLPTALALSLGLLGLTSTTAYASDMGNVPEFGLSDPGVPPGFGAFGVLVAVAGIASMLWRVSMARQMARDSGMDPDRAAAMSMMSDDGLEATYLASSLRDRPTETASAGSPARTVAERLRELDQLRADGLVTPEEYETRRSAILDSI